MTVNVEYISPCVEFISEPADYNFLPDQRLVVANSNGRLIDEIRKTIKLDNEFKVINKSLYYAKLGDTLMSNAIIDVYASSTFDSDSVYGFIGSGNNASHIVGRKNLVHRYMKSGGVRPNGYIAVSGEDVVPRRPVNVSRTIHAESDISVPMLINGDMKFFRTRYFVATNSKNNENVIIYIHGHSSRAEEAEELANTLLSYNKNITLVSFDLPNCGYSERFSYKSIGKLTKFACLDFIEQFILAFVQQLMYNGVIEEKSIKCVVGGSLGGNMCIRLSMLDNLVYPWLKKIICWSPASLWSSFENHVSGNIAIQFCDSEAIKPETQQSRNEYFNNVYKKEIPFLVKPQPKYWFSDRFKYKNKLIQQSMYDRYEVYSSDFRSWHWLVAKEQLIYSHLDYKSYDRIKSNLTILTGTDDNGGELYNSVIQFSKYMKSGRVISLRDVGHSIHTERPHFLSKFIIDSCI